MPTPGSMKQPVLNRILRKFACGVSGSYEALVQPTRNLREIVRHLGPPILRTSILQPLFTGPSPALPAPRPICRILRCDDSGGGFQLNLRCPHRRRTQPLSKHAPARLSSAAPSGRLGIRMPASSLSFIGQLRLSSSRRQDRAGGNQTGGGTAGTGTSFLQMGILKHWRKSEQSTLCTDSRLRTAPFEA